MKKFDQLKTGIGLSYVNMIIGNIIPLLYAPIMLRLLGQAEYGLYSLATSVTSYLSLMSMGIGTAVVRYLAKYRAENDSDGESRMLGLFSCIFCVIALMTLIVGYVLSQNLATFYGHTLTASELGKMELLTKLLSINTALSFVFSVYSSVITVHERFVFQQALNIFGTAIPPILNIILLYFGFSSVGLVFSALITSLVIYISKVLYCVYKLKIRPVFKKMPIYLIKELCIFSFFVFIANIVSTLHSATDKVILGALVGTTVVAVYNVGLMFRNIVEQVSVAISGVMMPRVTMMVDQHSSNEELTTFMIKIGRVQAMLIGLLVGGFCAFGREFVLMYAGRQYEQAYYVAVLIMVPMVVPLVQNIGNTILLAKNKHKFRSLSSLVTAIMNVFATWYLVPYWGVIGAAVTTCICNCIGSITLMNWYYHKSIGLNILAFWKSVFGILQVPILLTTIALFIGQIVDFEKPLFFMCGVVAYTLLYCIMMWTRLNEYEKMYFIEHMAFVKKKVSL